MWSYDRPKETGWYYLNYGDVVTPNNFEVVHITTTKDTLHGDKKLVAWSAKNGKQFLVEETHPHYKWLKVNITELNKVGNQ